MRTGIRVGLAALALLGLANCGKVEADVAVAGTDAGPAGVDAGTDAGVDAGCATPCGAQCCGEREVCNADAGGCVPVCEPESDSSFCDRLRAYCGSLTAEDNCRAPRTVDCGRCNEPMKCDEQAHACVCNPTDAEVCAWFGRTCGLFAVNDQCGTARTIESCGTCVPGDICSALGHCELCVGEPDAELCDAKGYECGTQSFTDQCGATRAVTCGSNCLGPETCQQGICALPPPPQNDTCASPEPLLFVQGVARAQGSTLWANDDLTPSCTMLGSADVVYSFELTVASTITIKVSPPPSNPYRPVLSLRRDCYDGTAASEVTCAANGTFGDASKTLTYLATGTWYLIVDGADAYRADFTLEMTQRPALLGDSCPDPILLALDPLTGIGSISGDNTAALSDTGGSCLFSNGHDLVYRVDLPSEKDLAITVTPTSTLVPTVHVRRTCDDAATELACQAPYGTDPVTLSIPRVAAGPIFIWVSSYYPTPGGTFNLDITATTPPPAPAGDSCSAPVPIVLNSVTHAARYQASTQWGIDDSAGTCAVAGFGLNGPDVVYSLTLTDATTLYAVVDKDPGETRTFFPALYLRTVCSSSLAADQVACASNAGKLGTSITADLQPGTYYLIIDGQNGTSGGYLLDVVTRASRAMANENCATAEAIPLDANGLGVAAGSTAGMANDYSSGSCMAGYPNQPDAVYYVATADTRDLVFTLLAGQGFNAGFYVRTTCGTSSSERACVTAFYGGQAATKILARVPAGTYYIFVDGSGNAGPFALTVEALPPSPPPAHDTCAGAQLITLPTSGNTLRITDSTLPATNGSAGHCQVVPNHLQDGPDLVYKFTPTVSTQVTATVTPRASAPNYRAALYLNTGCSATGGEVCAYALYGGPGDPVTISGSVKAGTTYYLTVDGVVGTFGDFYLDLTTDNLMYTNGDHCWNAISLDSRFTTLPNGDQVATIQGDATQGNDDGSTSCLPRVGARDFVYSFYVYGPSLLKVFVEPYSIDSRYEPNFSLRTSCSDPATDIACTSWGGHARRTVQVPVTTAGTYYVWVDTYAAGAQYEGDFQVQVTVSPLPAAPANDTCANAQSFTLPASGAAPLRISGTTICGSNDYTADCALTRRQLDGNDVVYTFTVSTATQVKAKVSAQSDSQAYMPALYIRRTCATHDNDLCDWANDGGSWAQVTASLPPGTYYLIVDGASGTYGDFDLDVSTNTTSYVPGDHCLNPVSLAPLFQPGPNGTQTATWTGTTVTAFNDVASTCYPTMSGLDLVYTFSVTRNSLVQVLAQPDVATSLFYPQFYLRTTCSDPATESYCAGVITPLTAKSGSIPNVAPGTYYLWIDTWMYTSPYIGTFSASVTIEDMPSPPAHDVCAGARTIVLPVTPPVTVPMPIENLAVATNHYSGSCGPSAGPDVVYRFTTTMISNLSAKLTPDPSSDYRPIVYVRSVCDVAGAANELACGRATAGGKVLTVTASSLPIGTYYIIVDSNDVNGERPGLFNLELTLTP